MQTASRYMDEEYDKAKPSSYIYNLFQYKEQESPRTRMRCVYGIVTRVCQRVLSTTVAETLVNESCQRLLLQGQESATF